jgi:hypothetical protein
MGGSKLYNGRLLAPRDAARFRYVPISNTLDFVGTPEKTAHDENVSRLGATASLSLVHTP